MATYYVRISGNDSNSGTSPAQAWRTIGKALGNSGISSGDVVYIGAGTYRETVTVGMTSATSETKIIGDVLGTYTGDAGEVVWSAYTKGDFYPPAEGNATYGQCLNLNGRHFLTFETLTWIGGYNGATIGAYFPSWPSKNIVFRRCAFFSSHGNQIITAFGGEPLYWLIENCYVYHTYQFLSLSVYPAVADYNINFTIRNCLFQGGTWIATLQAGSGTGTRGNGVIIDKCSGAIAYALYYVASTLSTANPSIVQNCNFYSTSAIYYTTVAGQAQDGGNNRYWATSMAANVTLNPTSRLGNFPNPFPLELGHSSFLGLPYKHPLIPYGSAASYPACLGVGSVGTSVTTDMLGVSRPSGSAVYYDAGTASSGTTSTLVDSTKNWPSSYLIGWKIRITAGTGSGQVKTIRTNSSTSITISGGAPAGGNWAVTPDSTSQYVIYQGPMVETGKATSGTTTTLVDSNANWATNLWSGYSCAFDNQVATVASNTATTLTFTATVTAPTASSTYSLYFPGASLTANLPAAGAFEGNNTGKIDSGTYDTSPSSLRLDGPAMQEFKIAVAAKTTVFKIRARYDSAHGSSTKPRALILAQPNLGITQQTATMTANAETWETLVLSITPAQAGTVTLRLESRAAQPWGRAWFDSFTAE